MPDNDQREELVIIRLAMLFLKNKFLLSIITLLFTATAIILSITATPRFTTTSKIIAVTSNRSNSSELLQMAAMAGINIGSSSDANPADFLHEIIKDAGFLQSITRHPWKYKGQDRFLGDIWRMIPDTTDALSKARYDRNLYDHIRRGKYILLTKDIKSGLITVSTSFEDPSLSYEINRYVVELLQRYIADNITTQAKEKRNFIEQRIQEVSQQLTTSENNLAKFKSRNQNLQSPELILEEQRLFRTVTINQELFLQLRKQFEIVSLQEKNDQPVIEMIKSPEYPFYKSKPEKLKIILLGFISGLLIASIIIIIKSNIQEYFHGNQNVQ